MTESIPSLKPRCRTSGLLSVAGCPVLHAVLLHPEVTMHWRIGRYLDGVQRPIQRVSRMILSATTDLPLWRIPLL